jgi:hypothetical protein
VSLSRCRSHLAVAVRVRVRHGTGHRPTRGQCLARGPVLSTSPTCPDRHRRWAESSPPFRGEIETRWRPQNRRGSPMPRQRRPRGENRQPSGQSPLGQSRRAKRQRDGRGKQRALPPPRGHRREQQAAQQQRSGSASKSLFTKAQFRLSKRHQRPANVPSLILTTICGSSEHRQRSRPRKQRRTQTNVQCELTDVINTQCAKTSRRDIPALARPDSRATGTFARM